MRYVNRKVAWVGLQRNFLLRRDIAVVPGPEVQNRTKVCFDDVNLTNRGWWDGGAVSAAACQNGEQDESQDDLAGTPHGVSIVPLVCLAFGKARELKRFAPSLFGDAIGGNGQ